MADLERSTQCDLYTLGAGGGRCAQHGGRTDWHHVVLRSEAAPKCESCNGMGWLEGGPPMPENIKRGCGNCDGKGTLPRPTAFICPTHHNQIHCTEEPWLYRVELPNGEYVYVDAPSELHLDSWLECIADEEVVDSLMAVAWPEKDWHREGVPRHWRVLRLWGNCGEALEKESTALVAGAEEWAKAAHQSAWRTARELYRLEAMGDAWQLHGYKNIKEFAEFLGFKAESLRRYLAAERTLHELPAIQPDQREGLRRLPIQLLITARKPITEMTTEQINTLIAQGDTGTPVGELIEEARLVGGGMEAKRRGKQYADVTLVAKAATFKIAVTYSDGDDPVGKAQGVVGAMRHVLGVDWAPRKQQEVDER